MRKIRRTTPAKSDGVKILPRSLLLAAVSSIGFIGFTAVPESQGAVFNGGSFTLAGTGTATPYPGTIDVTGLQTIPGSGNNVTLTLTNFSHTAVSPAGPDDLDMLLVGPTGANLIIWSDVGGFGSVGPLTITLSDAAASFLPISGPLTGGTFKPTNENTSEALFPFPSPAPSGSYGNPGPAGTATFGSVFNGTNPNGIWSLYIIDDTLDATGQSTTIQSWSLSINSPVIPEPGSATLIAGAACLLGLVRSRRRAS
ncbi:MAG TPA: hypothetical protein VIT91_06810 [Chthoniobacterales bacterium]